MFTMLFVCWFDGV